MNTTPPILKAVETEDGITLYSPDEDPVDAGVARVEALLGAPLAPGGQHVRYATHNRLLGLLGGQIVIFLHECDTMRLIPDKKKMKGVGVLRQDVLAAAPQ
jgi:hypothetical protein